MKKMKQNNRGAALVSIIIAMAVVALLGTVILYTAYSGLNMRLVGRTSANTFYSAEAALDEVTAGIEQEMSEQYVKAYTYVMSNYGTYTSVSDMQKDYKTEFILNMVDALNAQNASGAGTITNGSYLYDVSILQGYVNGNYGTGAAVTVTSADASEANGGNLLETLEDGLIIRNVKVNLTKNGYSNTIITDIKVSVPEVKFSLVSSMPDIEDYAYIAGSGISIQGGTTCTLKGNAYSGNTYTTIDNGNGTYTTSGSKDSMIFGTNATMDATNSSLLIIDGDAVLTASSKLSTGGQDTNTTKVTTLWADNIYAEKSNSATSAANEISLLGRTYISDDITLNGADNVLTLGGQFYGFCSGTQNAEDSSSIVINGQHSTLDFSGLDTLVIAGTAFVDASTVDDSITGNTEKNTDVNTGDSIALKSNQYAYMVPAECDGVVTNPMSYDQYTALTKNTNWKQAILNTTLKSLNKTILSYDAGVKVVPVFNASEGGTVYLYLEFSDVSSASAYFMDVYNSDSSVSKKVHSYMDNYLKVVKFNTDTNGNSKLTRLVTAGTALIPASYDKTAGTWTAAYTADTDSAGAIASEIGTYANTYEALCTKLVTSRSSLTSAEQSRTVYENLIDTDAWNNTSTTAKDSFFEYGIYRDGAEAGVYNVANVGSADTITFSQTSGDIKAILIDNENGPSYEVTGGKGLIVASGDVTVSGTFTGLIICKGKLTTKGNATLVSDEAVTGAAMRLSATIDVDSNGDTATVSVLNLFRGGENYQLPASGDNNDGTDMTDVRNCVAYENWTSQ